ncbi:MAG: AAA family ATPase [Bacteroidaceae bacterium]|nr:AAA family ATPase [Bacteroidaceae bacterium]
MNDLFSFLSDVSKNSDFKAKLSERGGYITFSNSGRRGGTKFFQIGLDNILQTLKDILTNLNVFNSMTEYDETPWRDNGSKYFKDPVANANSTVQTKPLFSTLSKVIIWANQPRLDSIDSDAEICLNKDALEVTITRLEEAADSFRPAMTKSHKSYDDNARQIIYYGAPGTGKSHCIKEETDAWEKKGRVVRTTFHPDSDYSTFVGAYKPTTESVQRYDIYNKPITRDGMPVMEQVITYDFVEQAFLHAYIDAWKNRTEPEFLIIEEINRGNCAQVFGDLFQLLDRGDDGYSEYAIRADKDLQKHLSKAFENVEIEDYPNVKTGKELVLPGNLYIRASMNTSDQSLFPIDSAFKRRWDWKYMPIAQGNDNGVELNWMIDVDGDLYDWWTFVKTINKHVFDTTNSEDKQLGFFFCKAKGNVISAETFVCKVIFYLWNDVFKDFGFDDRIFEDKEDNVNPKLSFDKFYLADGKVNVEKIKAFLANLEMKPMIGPVEEEIDDESTNPGGGKWPKYSINGSSEQFTTPQAVRRVIEDYARQNEDITVDEMIGLWNGISERNNLLVASWQPSPNDNQPFADKRRTRIDWKSGTVWMITGWTEDLFKKFVHNVKQKLDINIVKVN